MERVDSFFKNQLVLQSWRYGNVYGGHQPTLLIAQVFQNRRGKGWGGWKEVLENAYKYSATIEQPSGFPDPYDKSFLRILTEIDAIYDGTAKDVTNGALFFGDTTNITNEWFLRSVARNNQDHRRVANTGTLTFWD